MEQPGATRLSTKAFGTILVAVALAGVGALLYLATRPKGTAILVDAAASAGSAEGHLMGRADAPVQVAEFGDFECPHCAEFARTTEAEVRAKLVNTGIVALRFYDFPLPKFKNSWTAHLAASCAGEQGKFWEMHDKLYASQDEWNTLATNDPLAAMAKYAGGLGLDVAAFRTCVTTQHPATGILGNREEGTRRGVTGTPTFFAGRRMFHGLPYDRFKAIVDTTLAERKADSATKRTAR